MTFVDTIFLLTLINGRDEFHDKAVALSNRYRGLNLVTTDAAATIELSPIVTPPRMYALPPIQQLRPMTTGCASSSAKGS